MRRTCEAVAQRGHETHLSNVMRLAWSTLEANQKQEVCLLLGGKHLCRGGSLLTRLDHWWRWLAIEIVGVVQVAHPHAVHEVLGLWVREVVILLGKGLWRGVGEPPLRGLYNVHASSSIAHHQFREEASTRSARIFVAAVSTRPPSKRSRWFSPSLAFCFACLPRI